MKNDKPTKSCGLPIVVLFLILLGWTCINFLTSGSMSGMGLPAAIIIGGIGLLLSPFVFLIGKNTDESSIKKIFDLDFSESSESSDEDKE